MVGLVVRIFVNAIALWITTHIVPELSFGSGSDFMGILGVAVVFGFVNAVIRPVLKLLTFPLSFLTMGLFGLVVNGVLLLLVAAFSNALGLEFTVGGFPPDLGLGAIWWAIVGSIVLGIVSAILSLVPLPGD
jgi:putative membrane protein